MTKIEVNGRIVEVGDGFLDLSPEEQERTVEEIAASFGPQRGARERVMNQVNQGIAGSVGGLVDFINPFDAQTGSAREGLTQGMEAMGAVTERGAPEGLVENIARGTGEAAGAMIPIGAAAQGLSRAPGMVGQVAGTVGRSLTTRTAPVAEMAAGGVSQGARYLTAEAGGGPVAQETAAMLSPMAIPAATGLAGAALRNGPTGRAVQGAARTLAPYTRRGGMEVARTRMQDLAGGRERGEDLADRIRPQDGEEVRLSPAQQTQDPNMLGLEALAASQDPNLRTRLDDQLAQGQQNARTVTEGMGGNTDATREFFELRRRQFRGRLQDTARRAEESADARIRAIGPNVTEADASRIVADEIEKGFARAQVREDELWEAIPMDVEGPTNRLAARANMILDDIPKALKRLTFPGVAREMLIDGAFDEIETVKEFHGLFSAMRAVARDARVGPTPNQRLAARADEIAEEALNAVESVAQGSAPQIAKQLRTAIAYTAEMHDVFSRGAVGRGRLRTGDSERAVEPETLLRREIRPGPQGEVSARQFEEAAGGSERATDALSQYVRGLFSDSVTSASGKLTTATARTFLRNNSDLVRRYPALRQDIMGAVQRGESAEAMAGSVERRIKAANNARQSTTAEFLGAPAGQEVARAINSPNPARTARLLVNAARKDETGEALAGLKGAFSRHLIDNASRVEGGQQGLNPQRFNEMLQDPNFSRAARVVLSSQELARLQTIGRRMSMAMGEGVGAANVGATLSEAKAPKLLEVAARIIGANLGGQTGGGNAGASLQAAQIGSSRAKEILQGLVADRASQILADAVEDPDLFRALLTDVGSPRFEREAIPRILPYLTGAAAASQTEQPE